MYYIDDFVHQYLFSFLEFVEAIYYTRPKLDNYNKIIVKLLNFKKNYFYYGLN